MTDCYQPYEAFVPSEKHMQSKAKTFTVGGITASSDIIWQESEESQNATVSA